MRMKTKTSTKGCALLLAMTMIFALVVPSFAEIQWPEKIVSFEGSNPVSVIAVDAGTAESDLGLPEALRAVTNIPDTVDATAFVQADPRENAEAFLSSYAAPEDADVQADPRENAEAFLSSYAAPEDADARYAIEERVVYTYYYLADDGTEGQEYRLYGSMDGSENTWFACDAEGNITGVVQNVPVTWDNGGYDANLPGDYVFTAKYANGYSFSGEKRIANVTVNEATKPDADNTVGNITDENGNTVQPGTALTEQTIKTTVDGKTISVTGNLPEGATVSAERVDLSDEQAEALLGGAMPSSAELTRYGAYDIHISVNEQEWQPTEAVQVSVDSGILPVEQAESIRVAHVDSSVYDAASLNETSSLDSSAADAVASVETSVSDDQVVFNTDSFSVYVFYTVDFHFGDLTFSLGGEESILLSALFEKLGIDRSIDEITNVVFSNPSLLSVEKVADSSDWLLTSLQSFTTEEALTITFKDGTELVIKVTDPVYLPGTQTYYDERWEDAKAKFSWTNSGVESQWIYDGNYSIDGNLASAASPKGTPDHVGAKWFVRSYEQLRYACENAAAGDSVILQKDIDCGGAQGALTQIIAVANDCTIDGCGYSIFNVNMDTSRLGQLGTMTYLSLFDNSKTYTVNYKNVSIKSIQVISSATFASILSPVLVGGETITNCSVDNGLVRSGVGVCALVGGWGGQNRGDVNISNSYLRNVSTYAPACSNGFCGDFGYTTDKLTVKNCFAVDGIVISAGGHCGAFGGCDTTSMTLYENCFTNNDIYANVIGGGFLGTTHWNTTLNNCYSSGKVEGTKDLGGFFGSADLPAAHGLSSLTVDITNCYSTAMCGMTSSGTNLGGFLGALQSAEVNPQIGTAAIYTDNCYAAGETGSLSTSADSDHLAVSPTIGGFVGDNTNITETNCYYDKQTTAMREWASGASQSVSGVTGMLTTDTQKSGNGMTNPSFAASLGSAYVNNLGDGYYPELAVFANVTIDSWGLKTAEQWQAEPEQYSAQDAAKLAQRNDEIINLIKASSQASVSTVQLDTYEKDYAGNALPTTTYDTVRDMTAKAPLTDSSNLNWSRCGVTGAATLSNGSGAQTTVFGTTKDVITLEDNATDGWLIKDPYPGVDWLRVAATVNGQTASRSLRVCPTDGLYAGEPNTIVNLNTKYDHADDMKMVYTTGSRYAADISDLTYGVYPDVPLASAQSALLSTGGLQNSAALTALYAQSGQNDAYTGINVGNMQRTSTSITAYPAASAAKGNTLNTVIQKGTGIDEAGNITYAAVNLSGSLGQKFNGGMNFAPADVGRYLITYYWSINDGRYLTGTKGVTVRSDLANISISVEDESGASVSNACGTDAYTGTASPTAITGTSAGDSSTSPLNKGAGVSWTKKGGFDIISLSATLYDGHMIPHTVTIENPTEGSTVKIPMRYYLDDTDAEGNAVTYSTVIEQTYTVTKVGDVYSLVFNKTGTQAEPKSINGLSYNLTDLNADAVVVLVVKNKTATVRLKKNITNYEADLANNVFMIAASSTDCTANAQVTLKHGETSLPMSVIMEDGTARINISEAVPSEFAKNYTVTVVNATGSTATVSGRTVTIHPGDDVTIVINNTFKHEGYFKDWENVKNVFSD